ncbi:hypothetical protein AB6A40_005239 [Gnathostoma spinigerum]|uniref:Protein-serine O-palmitoleoyltransferase porcupine n=1 Tax=Gnathostoma spinigerum TaxID=75299 RepID=A0ABD6EEU7_9BILA
MDVHRTEEIQLDRGRNSDYDNVIYNFEEGEYSTFASETTPKEVLLLCSSGVLSSLLSTIVKLITFSIMKRFLAYSTQLKGSVSDFIITICGMYMLYTSLSISSTFPWFILYVFTPTTVIILSRSWHFKSGFISSFTAVGGIIFLQCLLEPDIFASFRGVLMITAMKITSYAYDVDSGYRIKWLEYLSYIFDPSSVLFGPWFSISDFTIWKLTKTLKEEVTDLIYASFSLLIALIFVTYSTCIIDSVFPQSGFWYYFGVAQSFRTSHYFVCYLSQSMMLTSGLSVGSITQWSRIEFPQSLVDVVVSWNLPMHRFLRKYVFLKFRSSGIGIAIFATYAFSSLLHGVNFQLSAVLLSLGLYTYAETRIRKRLSVRLDACVSVKECKEDCYHAYKKSSLLVTALSLMFTLLSVGHLIYLGMVFDGSGETTGYSAIHTLSVWRRCYFISHFVAFCTLLMSFFI